MSPSLPSGATSSAAGDQPTIDDWAKLDMRVGRIIRAEVHDRARESAERLWIDFGPLGELQSSAKVTERYRPEDLVGRQVVAVRGVAPLRVAGFRSDVLVLGVETDGRVVLLRPDHEVSPGSVVS